MSGRRRLGRDLLGAFVVRRGLAILVHGLKLPTELLFPLLGSFDLSSSCCQLRLLFLLLGKCRLLLLLLLCLFQLTGLDLFFKGSEASGGLLTLSREIVFLIASLSSVEQIVSDDSSNR